MFISKAESKKFIFSPYELCPCESGVKYKFCCHSKSKNSTTDNSKYNSQRIIYESQKGFNETDFEICFAFNKDECDSKIIGAHSLQNNGVLDKISKDGHVYNLSFDIKDNLPTLKFNKIGKNRASTFLGFCKHHDKEYFSSIEDQPYYGTELQNYLFAYRAFCFERHRKLRLKQNLTKLFKKFPQATKDFRILSMYRACVLDLKDKEIEYIRFKEIYEKNLFSNLESFVKEVPFKISFTGTTAVAVNVDINGQQTIDIYNYDEQIFIPSLYISVIPKETSSLIIVTRHIQDECYKDLIEGLKIEEDEERILKYVSFCLSEFSENVYFSPELINSLNERDRDTIISAFHSSLEQDPYNRMQSLLKGFRLNLFDFKLT